MPVPLAVGLLAAALLAACSPTAPSDAPAPLSGSSWVLTDVADGDGLRAAIDDSASLTFGTDAALAGSTGCNRFTGTWSAESDRLTMTPGATTLRACPGESATQEAAVLAALAGTARYRNDGETLALLDADGTVLAQYRSAATVLAGTAWRATGVNNGQGGVESTAGTGELSASFAADGTVSGYDGCGPFSGTFATDGARITIDAAAATVCGDPRQQPYLAALGRATTWRVDGNRLELRDNAGALQVGMVEG